MMTVKWFMFSTQVRGTVRDGRCLASLFSLVYVQYWGEENGEGLPLPCLPLLTSLCSVLRWGGRWRMVAASPPSPPPTWRTSLESNIFCTGRSVQYWAWNSKLTFYVFFCMRFLYKYVCRRNCTSRIRLLLFVEVEVLYVEGVKHLNILSTSNWIFYGVFKTKKSI